MLRNIFVGVLVTIVILWALNNSEVVFGLIDKLLEFVRILVGVGKQ